MNCTTCKDQMVHGKTTLTFDKGPHETIVIKEIPAMICNQCGDAYIDMDTSKRVEELVLKAENDGIKMGFLAYQPAA